MGNRNSASEGSSAEDSDTGVEPQDTELSRALQREDFEKAKNLVNRRGTLPSQNDLQLALLYCGRTSDVLMKMCDIVCRHIQRNCSLIKHVWAAYPYQKSEVVFVALTATTDKISIGLPYTILFRRIDEYNQERLKVTYCKESLEKPFTREESIHLTAALQEHSQTLMDSHSNVQMISACSVRSQNFGKFGEKIIPETCIVIYVDVKGLIPIAEEPLPNTLDSIPVDIREGGPRLLNNKLPGEYHDHLQMGCQIATEERTGTLGAFLECPITGEMCCLTCAYVIMNHADNPHPQGDQAVFEPGARMIFQPDPNTLNQIGYVKKAVFKQGGNGKTGVDAALIALTKASRLPITGEFPTANVEHTGFTARKPMVFTSGEMYSRESLPDQFECRSELLKFGCASGPTRGSFHLNGTSVRRREIEGTLMNFGFQLHNQFEVLSIGPSPVDAFATQGDSGALVFIPHQGNCSDLRAVGIIEGGTFNGTYLVTPIWDVLEALDVPHQLKTFPCHEESDNPITACFSNLSIASSDYQSADGSLHLQSQFSFDRAQIEENLGLLASRLSDEEKKTQEKTQELSAQITVTNLHFNSEVRDLHRKIDNVKQELNTRINQEEENNQRRHDETMGLLNLMFSNMDGQQR